MAIFKVKIDRVGRHRGPNLPPPHPHGGRCLLWAGAPWHKAPLPPALLKRSLADAHKKQLSSFLMPCAFAEWRDNV